jgi:hypothetical protein
MKPWQTPLKKAPTKREKKEQKKRIQVPRTKPKMGHQGAKEQIMFQSPHQSPLAAWSVYIINFWKNNL